jgi:hypothetical protein
LARVPERALGALALEDRESTLEVPEAIHTARRTARSTMAQHSYRLAVTFP